MNQKPPTRNPPPPPPMRKGDGTFVPLQAMTNEYITVNPIEVSFVIPDEEKHVGYFERLGLIVKYFLLTCAAVVAAVLYLLGWQYGANNYGMLGVVAMTVVTLLLLAIPKWSKEER